MGLKLSDLKEARDCYMCDNSYIDELTGRVMCRAGYNEYIEELGIKAAGYCEGYTSKINDRAGLLDNNKAIEFLLAGKSEFIAVSGRTGYKIKYKITRKESNKKDDNASEYVYFIKTVVDNQEVYAGILYYDNKEQIFKFSRGQKGKLDIHHINIKSLLYIINNLYRGNSKLNVRIYHMGRCGRCGRALTTPESILTGLGPECAKMLGIPRVKS